MGKHHKLPDEYKGKNIIPIAMDAAFFCERALKSLDKFDYTRAVRYFQKAIELEPNNPINYCNLAGTLSEMGRYDESNDYLIQVIQDIAPDMVECYFYLANNYLNMERFEQAEQYVLKYLEEAPEGEFNKEAEELLDLIALELGRAPRIPDKADPTVDDLHDRAKVYMEEGNFIKARNLLIDILRENPDFTAARNNLALSYYYIGELDRGLQEIRRVLHHDPSNIHALCNLAIFYSHTSSEEELDQLLDVLNKMVPFQYEEIFKLAATLGILGKYSSAYHLFRKLAKLTHYFDVQVLHYAAVSAFNLRKWKDARRWWEKAGIISGQPMFEKFIQLAGLVEKGKGDPEELSYFFPAEEEEAEPTSRHEFYDMIRKNPMIRSSFLWALKYGEKRTKIQVLQTLSLLKDQEAEEALRYYLLQPDEEESLKKIAVMLLHQMDAKTPYHVFMDGEEKTIYAPEKEEVAFIRQWSAVMECFEVNMGEAYGEHEHQEAHQIWIEFLSQSYPNLPQIRKKETWAAAVEYFVAKHNKKKVTQSEVARKYGVAASTLAKHFKQLNECLSHTIQQEDLRVR
ncbi:MAG: tetratricopeptide repeat protein [Bacillaceae bacterium]|nr:tetratricopeptide repeat protein [Bacillaceae bacterium]